MHCIPPEAFLLNYRRKTVFENRNTRLSAPVQLYGGIATTVRLASGAFTLQHLEVIMQPVFLCLLVLAVMFVNGWTDAPNSIATIVASGTLSFRRAALFAAVCDLLGVVIMSLFCPTVAETIFTMVSFGSNSAEALLALRSALLAIVLWAVLAWRFGIPTSESHALIAGLTGAALALHGGFDGVNAGAWAKVLIGFLLSTILGTFSGYYAARIAHKFPLSPHSVRCGQCFCAGATAFLHGAQDGQKFLALFLLIRALLRGYTTDSFTVPLPLALLCAGTIAAGVLCGGRRIIDTVARSAPDLTPHQGLAADLAGATCLLTASLTGLPVSTTHTKISAIFGAGKAAALPGSGKAVRQILFTWLATFPCCGLLAWGLTRLSLFYSCPF